MNHLKTSGRSQEHHRKIILEKRQEVLKELDKELIERMYQGSELKLSLGSDLGDLSMLCSDSELSVSHVARYSNTLKQIDQALERVEGGSYGLCEECGEKIDKRRLEIIPFSSYCVDCQKRMEKENSGMLN
jgi:DnaK suppressor protein